MNLFGIIGAATTKSLQNGGHRGFSENAKISEALGDRKFISKAKLLGSVSGIFTIRPTFEKVFDTKKNLVFPIG